MIKVLPSGQVLYSFNLQQDVPNFESFIREIAKSVPGWKNQKIYIESNEKETWFGYTTGPKDTPTYIQLPAIENSTQRYIL